MPGRPPSPTTWRWTCRPPGVDRARSVDRDGAALDAIHAGRAGLDLGAADDDAAVAPQRDARFPAAQDDLVTPVDLDTAPVDARLQVGRRRVAGDRRQKTEHD